MTPAPNLPAPDGIRPVYLPPYSPELQPAEHLWPVLDEPLANHYFGTLAELEHVVTEHCRVLHADQPNPGTTSHGGPRQHTPAKPPETRQIRIHPVLLLPKGRGPDP